VYAIVLAGGYAKRLLPLTLGTPKALLPIAGKPILDYIVDKLQALNPPLTKIVVSTNMLFQPQFETWLAFSGYRNIELVPDKASSELQKPGAIQAMANIINQLPEDDVLVIAGDGMFNDDLNGMLESFRKTKSCVVAIYEVATFDDATRCATVQVDRNGKILDLIEKPSVVTTKKVCGAIYLFKKGVNQQLNRYLQFNLPTDQPGRFIEWLCKQENVYGYKLADRLWDIGTHEAYRACDEYFGNLIKEVMR